jgi:hypothetical protein
MSKPSEITLLHKLGFVYIHFSSSTDDLLSARELDIILDKVDYFISSEEHHYRQTYHVLTDVLNWYMTLNIDERESEFMNFVNDLNSELQEKNKSYCLNNLKTLSEADGINTKEVSLIDQVKSVWS